MTGTTIKRRSTRVGEDKRKVQKNIKVRMG
jgi:hypothetical protein